MAIALDSHIPVPTGRNKHSEVRAALKAMEVGQSFITKSPPTIYAYGKEIQPPRKFVIRKEGKAFRCWRAS